MKKTLTAFIFTLASITAIHAQYREKHRPQIHFSPKQNWMNDPNGMVYYNGIYHLFFQHYPNAPVWGPMHWGHAISADLVHWQEKPIALYPDNLGYIFSGSVVVDNNNSSGLGVYNRPPLVAIFTQHDTAGERARTSTFQNQSIAYSDEGMLWTKYKSNPVLKNPGNPDFRDPKVMWYEKDNRWIMTLAVKDRVEFYASPDLKSWAKVGEFGRNAGAHTGVWECPDLFSLDDNGKQVWALIVSVNPGGPNGGTATQYFIGDFDGKSFTPFSNATKWIDYGPDDYAGVTWSNTGQRRIFLGWMSNWAYGQLVPTEGWRSAMTIPRNLSLIKVGGEYYIASKPVVELNNIADKQKSVNDILVDGQYFLTDQIKKFQFPCKLDISMNEAKSFSIVFSNDNKESLVVGYDETEKRFYIDRRQSGETDFEKSFAAKHSAPRIADAKSMNLTIVADVASVELFADNGLSVMTSIFFPSQPYNQAQIKSPAPVTINNVSYTSLKSIWK